MYINIFLEHQTNDLLININDKKMNYTCGGEYPGPTTINNVILFICPPDSRGSNVTILKTSSGSDYLGLCEVEVYGHP